MTNTLIIIKYIIQLNERRITNCFNDGRKLYKLTPHVYEIRHHPHMFTTGSVAQQSREPL